MLEISLRPHHLEYVLNIIEMLKKDGRYGAAYIEECKRDNYGEDFGRRTVNLARKIICMPEQILIVIVGGLDHLCEKCGIWKEQKTKEEYCSSKTSTEDEERSLKFFDLSLKITGTYPPGIILDKVGGYPINLPSLI
jgi:hypothetical protein